MIVEIPCVPGSNVSSWTQRTALEGRDYLLTFDWVQRDGRWRLTLADQDGGTIAVTVLATRYPLLWGVLDERRPAGQLVVIDTVATPEIDPGFSDLGTRHMLVYAPAEDL